jgi:hypothetical protein
MGRESLCGRCNQRTAANYGNHFFDFFEIVKRLSLHSTGVLSLKHAFTICPLEVAKQIATMVLAANDWTTLQGDTFRGLRYLVEHPNRRGIPPGIRLFAYIAEGSERRLAPMTGHVLQLGEKTVLGYAEIACPPLGLLALSDNDTSTRIASRLNLTESEITRFFDRSPNQVRAEWLLLRRLTPIGITLLDYKEFGAVPNYHTEEGFARHQQKLQRRQSRS